MLALLLLLLQAAPREEVVEIPGEKLKLAFVHVPVEGTSMLPYAIAKHETTWEAFRRFYREDEPERRSFDGLTRPSLALPFFGQLQCPEALLEPGRPVIGLRWHSAMAYADWLTAKTGRKFRLPTDVEWEHAARASGKGLIGEPWLQANSGGRTRVPGESKANAWGLHDMLGNVWEVMLEPVEFGTLQPVYRGGAWDSPEAEAGIGVRQGLRPEWFAADPLRPRSLWWLTGGFNQGLRVVCVGDEAAMKASAVYVPNIGVKAGKSVEKAVQLSKEDREKVASRGAELFRTLTIEVRNGGDATIEELELQAYFLDPKGAPHLVELGGDHNPGRPNFTWVHPVLRSGRHAVSAKPLAPGESRVFDVDVPETTDAEHVDPKAFGARATWVRLKP